jgi:hypothetical protein
MKVFGTMFDSGYAEDKCTKVVEKLLLQTKILPME